MFKVNIKYTAIEESVAFIQGSNLWDISLYYIYGNNIIHNSNTDNNLHSFVPLRELWSLHLTQS